MDEPLNIFLQVGAYEPESSRYESKLHISLLYAVIIHVCWSMNILRWSIETNYQLSRRVFKYCIPPLVVKSHSAVGRGCSRGSLEKWLMILTRNQRRTSELLQKNPGLSCTVDGI